MKPVQDPSLLAMLDGQELSPVTDPGLLDALDAPDSIVTTDPTTRGGARHPMMDDSGIGSPANPYPIGSAPLGKWELAPDGGVQLKRVPSGEAALRNIASGTLQPVGGLGQMIADLLNPIPEIRTMLGADVGEAILPHETDILGNASAQAARVAGVGRSLGEEAGAGVPRPASLASAAIHPGNTARYYGGMVEQSAPIMAGAIATGGVLPGATVAGASTAGQTYGSDRAQGDSENTAMSDAALQGGIEALGEAVGLSPVLAKGMSPIKRALATAALEPSSEAGTGAGQYIAGQMVHDKPIDSGELARQTIDSGIAGIGMTAPMTAAGVAIDAMRAKPVTDPGVIADLEAAPAAPAAAAPEPPVAPQAPATAASAPVAQPTAPESQPAAAAVAAAPIQAPSAAPMPPPAAVAPAPTAPSPEPAAVEATAQPAAAAARARFASPDEAAATDFTTRATAEGVDPAVAARLAPKAPADDVTGYYDGRVHGVKSGAVTRAQAHVEATGEPAFFVDADVVNLGGLNAAMDNNAGKANTHLRAMTDILRSELESTGGDVVPMRTGGDELGLVVVNAPEDQVRAAMAAADAKVRAYAQANGLAKIPHHKGYASTGVGLHLGAAPIVPGASLSDIFGRASAELNLSKQGVANVQGKPPARTGVVAPAEQPAGVATPVAEQDSGNRRAPAAEAAPTTRAGHAKRAWKPSGKVSVGRDGIARQVMAPAIDFTHDHLMHWLAAAGGINADSLRKAADFDYSLIGNHENTPFGVKHLQSVRRNGGLTLDQVREKMQQDGWLPASAAGVENVGDDDAAQMILDAVNGKTVYHPTDNASIEARARNAQEEERAQSAQRKRMDEEQAVAEGYANLEEKHAAERAIQRQQDAEDHQQAVADYERAHPPQPAPRGQGGLFPPATTKEQVAGAAAEKDAKRDGRTGRDIPSASGLPLFAGPAPAQADIEDQPAGNGGFVTGTKNEVTDAERAQSGRPEREKSAPKSNEDTLAEARAALEADPNLGTEAVERLANAGVDGISLRDEAILLAHKTAVMNQRNAAADRALDMSLPESERDSARRTYEELTTDINAIDAAAYNSGREWGRFGQFRQRLIRDDFSLEGMERKARMARMGNKDNPGVLTPEELAELRTEAARIAVLQDKLEVTEKALEEARVASGGAATYQQMVHDLAAELGVDRSKPAKQRPSLERLRQQADESREALRKMMGRTNAGVDPTAFFHLARIGAYHIANGVTKLADWLAKMRAELGAKLYEETEPALTELHEKLKKAAGDVSKVIPKPQDVLAKIDAAKLTSRDVAALARAHILAGTHGVDAVMAAVHADLKDVVPGITERDVRRLFSDYGHATFPSKAADKVELREIRRLVQLQESIDRLKEGLAPLKTGPQRDKATQAIREKQAELNDLLKQMADQHRDSPERLASYQAARRTSLTNQIEDLEKQIAAGERTQRAPSPALDAENQALKEQRDALRKQLNDLTGPAPKSPEQRYQDQREGDFKRRIKVLQERLAADDYSRSPRPAPRALNERNQSLAFELRQLKDDFLRKQFEQELKNRHPIRKIFGGIKETFNLARAIVTSIDLSGVLRQGGFIALGHPARAARALPEMLHAFVSKEAEFRAVDDLAKRPNAPLYKKYKLEITDHDVAHQSHMEEVYMSRWIDKIPKLLGGGLVRGSARSYTTFLNRLRADSFDAMAASFARGQELSEVEGRALANYINVATGRGNLGKFQQASTALNTVFFAPKWVTSRFQLLFGQPLYGGTMRTRGLIAQEYARFLAGTGVLMALTSMALKGYGDDDGEDKLDIVMDPRSTDFMKIRVGNVTLDPLSGLQQPTVLLSRLISGQKLTASGKLRALGGDKFGDDDATDLIGRFLRTKLAPVPGGLLNWISGRNVVGQKQDTTDVLAGMVTPLSLQNIGDIMEETGLAKGSVIELLNMFGVGVQYRDPAQNSKKKAAKPASADGMETKAGQE